MPWSWVRGVHGRFGGVGADYVFPASPFPPRVWRAVPSGCPLSSLAGTPLHAVCAFRGLGPVALLVFPVCLLRVSFAASAPPPLPLVGSVWCAHFARSQCWAPVGPFHAVRAPLCVLPRFRAPFGLLGRGASRSCSPPAWLRVVCPPLGHPRARALASWLCALGERHEGAQGGHLLPGRGASGVGRSASPDRSFFGTCGRGPLPTGCGCGVCGCGDPSSNPRCALLRAGLVRCGGGTRAPGGAPLACAWGVWGQALSDPRPLILSDPLPGPLPTGCGCGGCGRGDPSPTPQRALLRAGFARCGSGTRAPGVDAFCLSVGRPGSRALPAPIAGALGRAAGAHYPLAVGAGGRDQSPTNSARSCELALRAVGAGGGPSGGAPLAWAWGVRGSDDRSSFGACCRGPLPTACGCRGLRVWKPVTLVSRLCALWGWNEGAEGGRPWPRRRASRVGRSPTPNRPSCGACCRGPLPTGCGCGGCGRGDP